MLTKHIGHTMMTKRSILGRSMFARTLAVVLCLGSASTACAGVLTTWSGASSQAWNNASNWSTQPTVSTSGTIYSLVYTGTARSSNNNNIGTTPNTILVDLIDFRNNGTTGQTTAFAFTAPGNRTLTLVNGGTVTTAAATVGSLNENFSTLSLTLAGTGNFILGSNHGVTLNSAVSGGSLVKSGAGELVINGSTSLTRLSIVSGVAQLNSTSISGSIGQISLANGATLRTLAATGTSNASFSLSGTSTITANNNSNVTFSNSTFNTANAAVTTPSLLNLAGGGAGNQGTQTINGVIQDNSGSGRVSLNFGAPTTANVWVLKGSNTYTGTTNVTSGGILLMDGQISASSTTTSSGYLGGSGTFGGLVQILGGTLSPGGSSTSGGVIDPSIATLTVGSLTLGGSTSTATTMMQITGSGAGQFDQIVGSGSIQYGGTLALSLTGSYAPLTSFQLFSGFSTPRTGDFAAITLSASGTPYAGMTFTSFGDNNNWQTGWQNNQKIFFSEATGTLTIVPEPSTIVFAGMGIAVFGASAWWRRRRKNAPQLAKLVAR